MLRFLGWSKRPSAGLHGAAGWFLRSVQPMSEPTVNPTVEVAPEQQAAQLPPYRVILHNDDVNTFDHVILAILKLTPLDPFQALQRTLEAHESGQSLLLVTHQERAELYVDQFAALSLTVTCEPGD
jgi:ATP-dependent Clp protease adaptor protein ClpS